MHILLLCLQSYSTIKQELPSRQPITPSLPDLQKWSNGERIFSFISKHRTTHSADAFKLLTLGIAFGSIYLAITTRAKGVLLQYHVPLLVQCGIVVYVVLAWGYLTKSLSYASPKAFLNLLLPISSPQLHAPNSYDRIPAFKKYIADLESRRGGDKLPEFPPAAAWLNTPHSLRLDIELRNKILILDFWTYCCINCIHILPDLAAIEKEFSDQPVAVVGIHSAKFDNEKETAAIRSAVLRYDIRHPVVNDHGMVLWKALGVIGWPTLVIVGPTGRVLSALPGEGRRQDVQDMVTAALEYYSEQGLLDNESKVPIVLESEKDTRVRTSPLRYPGKLAIGQHPETNHGKSVLFISDSGNHRILVIDLNSGECIDSYGGNGPDLRDGSANEAAFNRPQGVAFCETTSRLYVCDTENHSIREIDLRNKTVNTLVGDLGLRNGLSAHQRLKLSPWDCIMLDPRTLLVAMAGQNQLWKVDVSKSSNPVAVAVSGTGAERNKNGPSGTTTAWAQPSGLALLPGSTTVLVADSESSSIRKFDLSTGGSSPCVGGDPLFSDNLFKFGDNDGDGSSALLQHPLAVACSARISNECYVADSYNHKLKLLDPYLNTIRSVAGNGQAGSMDGNAPHAQFSEPSGLAVDPMNPDNIYIADTNNSAIRIYNSRSDTVRTLRLKGVPKPRSSSDALPPTDNLQRRSKSRPPSSSPNGTTAVGVPPGATVVRLVDPIPSNGSIEIRLPLPPGHHLTPGTNSQFECIVADDTATFQPGRKGPLVEKYNENNRIAFASIKYSGIGRNTSLCVVCTLYYCSNANVAEDTVCRFREIVFEATTGADETDEELFGYDDSDGGNPVLFTAALG